MLCWSLLAAVLLSGAMASVAASKPKDRPGSGSQEGLCVTLCNHWSYTGIGWQLGIESDVLSATDAMEMADRAGVKTCLNLDARAYELMAAQFPEVAKRLSQYLAEGKIELIGGTYGQPMGTMFSGESNIRQIVYGRKAIKKALGYDMATFLEEEEFTHPQLPQILMGAGFRYASLAQVDTWGRAGIPPIEVNIFSWKGKDGTTIPTTPKNALFRAPLDWANLSTSPGYAKLRAQGKPLLMVWEEFGWEPPEQPTYLTAPAHYRQLTAEAPVEYVTLREYMQKYGAHPQKTVALDMDAWDKSLTWGLGGDQLRIYDRKVEGTLLAAERFDAVASALGAKTKAVTLDAAWKDLLASQSHDVGLCEYSRWQQDRMAPLDRIEDHHNFTWGALGYNLMDRAEKAGRSVLASALKFLTAKFDSGDPKAGRRTCTVFNPCAWERTDIVLSGRIYPVPGKATHVVVRDPAGNVVPTQLVQSETDHAGNLTVANVAFLATDVPSLGYSTYSLDFTTAAPAVATDLKVDPAAMTMENRYLKIAIDPTNGAVRSLIDKRTGREMLRATEAAFPTFKGKPNIGYPLRANIPDAYDSSQSKGELTWLETGPVRATLKARHRWSYMLYETRVSLSADQPFVEVTTRVLPEVPPAPDVNPPDIKEGYWLSFAPAFAPVSALRDYPLAVEATQHPAFHALTFVDLVGKDGGLLILHPGTQYFRIENTGGVSNLLMREWESHFTGEYGWPRYAEYRHALYPHSAAFTNADRLQAATDFSQKLIAVVGSPHRGSLPPKHSFLRIAPSGVQLLALRRQAGGGLELRVVEVEGQRADASVALAFPPRDAEETDLLGNRIGTVTHTENGLRFGIQPWKVRTFGWK